MTQGIWYAIGAYVAWGLLPIYLHWLRQVPPLQIVAHRIVWACVLLGVIVFATEGARVFRRAVSQPRVLAIYTAAAVLIAINWLVFVWGVAIGQIVEVSLGYFINPLVSVVLGIVFLGERLRGWQWLPIALAALGMLYLTAIHGTVPWIALALAFSFGVYGLVKKTAPLGALFGLTLETAILLIPATAYLFYVEAHGSGVFTHDAGALTLLLIGSGAVTAVPLLLFAAAARRIPLWLIGMLQYIAPTLQFLLGVFVYHEPFARNQLIGYSLVWLALFIFAAEGVVAHRSAKSSTHNPRK